MPSGSRFLLLSDGEVGYADFLNCSNRSASRSRSGRSSPRLGISNSSREYKETPVGGNAGVSETDDHGELGESMIVLSMEQSDTTRSSGFMIAEVERRFPVAYSDRRPTDGLSSRLDRIKGRARRELWRKGVAMTPSGTRDVLNDALSIYFGNPTLASALVARWCARSRIETGSGVFQVRENEPTPR
jgi:hypothetical protein